VSIAHFKSENELLDFARKNSLMTSLKRFRKTQRFAGHRMLADGTFTFQR
jgi:hypothetical protein